MILLLSVLSVPPPVFSYVVDSLLAGHGLPSTENHMKFLEKEGIKYLVTLMEELPEAIQKYKSNLSSSILQISETFCIL